MQSDINCTMDQSKLTPIDQEEIIPLSERSKLFQEIIKDLFRLKSFDPDRFENIHAWIKWNIADLKADQEKETAEIIPFNTIKAGGAR